MRNKKLEFLWVISVAGGVGSIILMLYFFFMVLFFDKVRVWLWEPEIAVLILEIIIFPICLVCSVMYHLKSYNLLFNKNKEEIENESQKKN